MSTTGRGLEHPWQLALIAEDRDAIKVAAAYYTLPKRRRDDLAAIRELAGISKPVEPILTRLRAVGMLQGDAPRPELVALMNQLAVRIVPPRHG